MKRNNNVNDNVIVSLETPITMNNDNDNDNVFDRRVNQSRKVEMIADRLVEIYGNPRYRAFYCKVAWKLPEATIWNHVEQAAKGNHPAKLFSHLCKREGV